MNAAILTLALMAPAAPPARRVPAPDVKENVRTGLQWLAKRQKEDGSWAAQNGLPTNIPTAHAGLALLMEGSTLKRGAYAPNLRKAVEWAEKHASADGRLGGKPEEEMYQYIPGHAQMLLFLACAYDVDDDPDRRKRIGKLLEKGVAFAIEGQTRRGGWGFVAPRADYDFDDAQCTGTVLQGLFAAQKVGIDVPRKATDRGVAYLVKATARDGGVISTISGGAVPMAGAGLPGHTAVAAAALLMTDAPRPEALPRWVKSARAGTDQQVQFLRGGGAYGLIPHYHMARAAHALGENGHARLDPSVGAGELVRWSAHRAKLFKVLKEVQAKDGTWPDPTFGPEYATALALIILQLDNGYLPALSR